MEIFKDFFEEGGPWEFISRYGHVLSGVTWIGLLYFFNFVQVPAYAQLSDAARSEAMRGVSFRALWWFRYAALLTFLFGVSIVAVKDQKTYFEGPSGTSILTGILFGVTMFVNVWGVIWRNQKVVIGNAAALAACSEADPAAPAAAKRAARASRANTLFSIPMLWFMVFTSHLSGIFGSDVANSPLYWLIVLATWAFIEASALGFIGGLDNSFNALAFDDHRRTIIGGFVYLVVLYFLGWELILGG
ncbi:urate hydroxylase PuuD [soil metagenome]